MRVWWRKKKSKRRNVEKMKREGRIKFRNRKLKLRNTTTIFS